ncbi:hypothetical protein E2C01_014919 [Portunus trituberculatus]|uniref:Uncharacterized protein n=1 Tax=Portunus trituberculatus TaxID=210409 RepID=A0A5B7DLR0_PORTR|nr:hypothetical protein [Portunus trituberculatus]
MLKCLLPQQQYLHPTAITSYRRRDLISDKIRGDRRSSGTSWMRGDGATDGEGGLDGPSRCQPHELPLHAHAGVCITYPHKCLIPHVRVMRSRPRMNKAGCDASLVACGGRPACEEDAGRLECLAGRGSECADLGIAAASTLGIKDGSMLAPSVFRGRGA